MVVALVTAIGMAGALSAGSASAATANTTLSPAALSMAPIVGVRQSGDDECSVGPVSGTNCAATIVIHGDGLPTADPSALGVEEYGDNSNVAVVDNDDGSSGWQAGHLTDDFSTCKVIVGESTSTTLILQVGDLGPTCPGYSINPGDSVQVIVYNSDGSEYDEQTADAVSPGTEPLVSDVNPPTGPEGGGTDAAPGTGSVTVTTSDAAAPEAVWFDNPSGLSGATGVATDNFSAVDATHYSVVPPDSGPQGDEGVTVEVADSANGTSPQACAVLLPTGCQDEYMYMSEHADTFGPSDPFNLNWSESLGSVEPEGSGACGAGSTSGVSADLSIGGSVTGGGLGLQANYGVSQSELDVPETLVGSATLTVSSPIVVTVTLQGTLSACEQIPIPDLSIPDVAGFYFVVGGSLQGQASLTITIDKGTYTLSGGYIPGSNADDTRGATVVSNCVDSDGNPTTDCVTTAVTASLTGTLTVSPLWLQVGPSFANVGAGLTAAATGTISYPPLAVDGDICAGGTWFAQVDVGPLSGSKGGTFLGPFNIFGDGSLCPLGATGGGGTGSAPGAPRLLRSIPRRQRGSLAWKAPGSDGGSAITGYNVYEGTSPGGESSTPVNPSPLSTAPTKFVAPALANGTTYYFTVTAVNANGESTPSNELAVTPAKPAKAPHAPTVLTAVARQGKVKLRWRAPKSDGGSPITGYNVYEGTTPGGEASTPVNASLLPTTPTNFVAGGLTSGTTYYFTVTAVSAAGESVVSNEVSATATRPSAPGRSGLADRNGTRY